MAYCVIHLSNKWALVCAIPQISRGEFVLSWPVMNLKWDCLCYEFTLFYFILYQLRVSEMEMNKARNLLEHEEKIFSRPARTWFQNKADLKRKSGEVETSVDVYSFDFAWICWYSRSCLSLFWQIKPRTDRPAKNQRTKRRKERISAMKRKM